MKDRIQKIKTWTHNNIETIVGAGVGFGIVVAAFAIAKSMKGGETFSLDRAWEKQLTEEERQTRDATFEEMFAACRKVDELEAELKSRHS